MGVSSNAFSESITRENIMLVLSEAYNTNETGESLPLEDAAQYSIVLCEAVLYRYECNCNNFDVFNFLRDKKNANTITTYWVMINDHHYQLLLNYNNLFG